MKTGLYLALMAVILGSIALTGCQKDEGDEAGMKAKEAVENAQPDPGKAKPKDHPAH